MKRFDAHIGSIDSALQETPEVLKAIGMDTTVHILDSMVNDRMSVFVGKSAVGWQRVGVERRARFDMLADFSLNNSLATGSG